MRRVGHSLAITVLLLLQSTPIQAKEPTRKKAVTEQASFVVYVPEGWKAKEGVEPGYRTLSVSDPDGKYEAALSCGWSLAGNDCSALAKAFVARIGGQYPDLEIRKSKAKRFKTITKAHIVTSCRKFDTFGDWYLVRNLGPVRRIFTGKSRKDADDFYYDVKR